MPFITEKTTEILYHLLKPNKNFDEN